MITSQIIAFYIFSVAFRVAIMSEKELQIWHRGIDHNKSHMSIMTNHPKSDNGTAHVTHFTNALCKDLEISRAPTVVKCCQQSSSMVELY